MVGPSTVIAVTAPYDFNHMYPKSSTLSLRQEIQIVKDTPFPCSLIPNQNSGQIKCQV